MKMLIQHWRPPAVTLFSQRQVIEGLTRDGIKDLKG